MTTSVAEQRRTLIARLFPDGPPTLWCPPLTHYTADGGLDHARIGTHLRTLAPFVKGVLVPGSTGDGWEMDDAEARELLESVLGLAPDLGIQVLVGALKPDPDTVCRTMADTMAWLRERTATADDLEAMVAARVVGFAFCPPRGADLAQSAICDALASALELGLPSALYQLPQITQNEAAPETVAALAARFANLYMMKDSSGGDRVATAGLDLGGVFLVRGAECDYHRWFHAAGGPYGGFLLSTANCFAPLLQQVIEGLEQGRQADAQATAELVSRAISGVFDLVDGLPHGNMYTNANKAIDHFLAHGPAAAALDPPMLHAGVRLPMAVIEATGALLTQLGLVPSRGYLSA